MSIIYIKKNYKNIKHKIWTLSQITQNQVAKTYYFSTFESLWGDDVMDIEAVYIVKMHKVYVWIKVSRLLSKYF